MNKRILIVEDEAWVVKLVRGYLEQAGYCVVSVEDGATAMETFDLTQPALVILDLMLPGSDGFDITRQVRKKSDVPIIMLTARKDEVDRITGLELGADDYVSKPFSPRELVSRVRAVLRRTETDWHKTTVLEYDDIYLDVSQREVWVKEQPIELTPMEFDLLAHLMQFPGRVFTRLHLLETLRGNTYESFERSVDTHIKRLRQKIEPDSKHPRYILTVFGVGYKFATGSGPK